MKTYQVDKNGFYGNFGGAYIPEILHQCVQNLKNAYLKVMETEEFKQEFAQLLRDYVGGPSPLYLAKRLSDKYGCKIYLKREDLNHTGAHKINNAIAVQRLLQIGADTVKNAFHHRLAVKTVQFAANLQKRNSFRIFFYSTIWQSKFQHSFSPFMQAIIILYRISCFLPKKKPLLFVNNYRNRRLAHIKQICQKQLRNAFFII